MVLSSQVQHDLEPPIKDHLATNREHSKPETKLVLHSVFFGTPDNMAKANNIVQKLKKEVRDNWREKITKEDSQKKDKPEQKPTNDKNKKNEEESIFEKTRFGWLLRDLQINTDAK